MSKWTDFFDELHRILRQTAQLLKDCDTLMDHHGFVSPIKSSSRQVGTQFSYSIEQPDNWYARWVTRFYCHEEDERPHPRQALAFVAVFLSDECGTGDWIRARQRLERPLVIAGMFTPVPGKPIRWEYWQAKHWFWSAADPIPNGEIYTRSDLDGHGESWKSVSSFAVPLEEISGVETLAARVIQPLHHLLAPHVTKTKGTDGIVVEGHAPV